MDTQSTNTCMVKEKVQHMHEQHIAQHANILDKPSVHPKWARVTGKRTKKAVCYTV